MALFPGFTPRALTFFRQLAKNNRREWFEEHRETYEAAVLVPLRLLVEEMDVRLANLAPEIVGDSKRSLFRIHRDVRFSKDKTPYKTHAAAWFYHRAAGRSVGTAAEGGAAGFYFHIEPGASISAGGLWMPSRPVLNALREAIAKDPSGFRKTIETPAFKKRFGKLSEEGMLTRLPRGFAPGHPAEAYLRYRSFTVHRAISDEDVLDRKLPAVLERDFERMLPLVRWLNAATGYRPATSR